MTKSNPFEVVEDGGERFLRGVDPSSGGGVCTRAEASTFVAVCPGHGTHGSAPVVMEIPGQLWEPTPGTQVQLCEPNRLATVCSVYRQVGAAGHLEVIVYLDDPETTEPDPPKPKARGTVKSAARQQVPSTPRSRRTVWEPTPMAPAPPRGRRGL
jgi:hypothetical protein